MRHVRERTRVEKHNLLMCSRGDSAAPPPSSRVIRERICPSKGCDRFLSSGHKFYYALISEQLFALCRERYSSRKLLDGCSQGRRAIINPRGSIMYDFL